MHTFSIRDLRERTGELSQEAEKGNLALITKHGHPMFVSVPFSENLIKHGVHTALAESLFQSGSLSLGKAAKLAGQPKVDFTEHLSRLDIDVVNYSKEELKEELSYLASA